jgi:hypothetical protein
LQVTVDLLAAATCEVLCSHLSSLRGGAVAGCTLLSSFLTMMISS